MLTRHDHRLGRRIALLTAATGLALVGCGSPGENTTAPATPAVPAAGAPTAEAVRWTDAVCGALVPVVENLSDAPEFDITAPAATRDAFAAYLAQAQTTTDQALTEVTEAGAAPVPGGEEIAANVRSDITELRDDLADARDALDQTDPGDTVAIGRSVLAAGNVVGAVGNSAQALAAIDGDPRLDAAYAQAESCERLRGIDTVG